MDELHIKGIHFLIISAICSSSGVRIKLIEINVSIKLAFRKLANYRR